MAELSVNGIGVATADPEIKKAGEFDLCTVNLAFNKSFKRKNEDSYSQQTTFLRCQIWGNKAVRMAELIGKGDLLYVSGYLKQDTWTDDDGNKKVAYTLEAKDFQKCEKSKSKNTTTKSKKKDDSPPVEAEVADGGGDDNIPF